MFFGKLPDIFPYWLQSCKLNSSIDWLLITDQNIEGFSYPPNFSLQKTSFESIVARIQNNFNFKISIKTPYRICDFRPAFGEIFQNEIRGYNFWGYCDIDMIFGDIRHFITDDILEKYSKIGFCGHSTLFLNDPDITNIFRSTSVYQSVFRGDTQKHYFYDEDGITKLFRDKKIPVFCDIVFADIDPDKPFFYLNFFNSNCEHKSAKKIFLWENGHLFCYSLVRGKILITEFMYVHFLRREISVSIASQVAKSFLVVPNHIVTDLEGCISSETLFAAIEE